MCTDAKANTNKSQNDSEKRTLKYAQRNQFASVHGGLQNFNSMISFANTIEPATHIAVTFLKIEVISYMKTLGRNIQIGFLKSRGFI